MERRSGRVTGRVATVLLRRVSRAQLGLLLAWHAAACVSSGGADENVDAAGTVVTPGNAAVDTPLIDASRAATDSGVTSVSRPGETDDAAVPSSPVEGYMDAGDEHSESSGAPLEEAASTQRDAEPRSSEAESQRDARAAEPRSDAGGEPSEASRPDAEATPMDAGARRPRPDAGSTAPGDAATSPGVRLVLVGDTHGFGAISNVADPLAEVRAALGEPDLFVFNHEGVLDLTPRDDMQCPPAEGRSTFHNTSEVLPRLTLGRDNVAGLANNHVLDCGADGLQTTLALLQEGEFRVHGAGADLAAACQPLLVEAGGRRFEFLSYLAQAGGEGTAAPSSAGAAEWAACGGPAQVAAAAASGATVIVSFHFHLSRSWTAATYAGHYSLTVEALEAGADLVVGHGPHVPQGVLVRDSGIGMFSLGNFLFEPGYSLPDIARDVLVAEATFTGDTVGLTLWPFTLDEQGIPRTPSTADSERLLTHIAQEASAFGTELQVNEGALILARP